MPTCLLPTSIHVIPPWSSWRLQEMSHKILLKYITFYQNSEISGGIEWRIFLYILYIFQKPPGNERKTSLMPVWSLSHVWTSLSRLVLLHRFEAISVPTCLLSVTWFEIITRATSKSCWPLLYPFRYTADLSAGHRISTSFESEFSGTVHCRPVYYYYYIIGNAN